MSSRFPTKVPDHPDLPAAEVLAVEQEHAFQAQTTETGAPNPQYVDMLEVTDPPVRGQEYGVFSFVSPDDIIRNKDLFFFHEFLKTWSFNSMSARFAEFLPFIAHNYKISAETLLKDWDEFLEIESETMKKECTLKDQFDAFMLRRGAELQAQYDQEVGFRTNTRGFKFDGAFATVEEAQKRAEFLQQMNPRHPSRTVGPAGYWLLADPKQWQIPQAQFHYHETELNQLMHEREKNMKLADMAHAARMDAAKKMVMEENVRRATKTGNKLTQMLNADGQLVGTTNTTAVDFFGGAATAGPANENQVIDALFGSNNVTQPAM